VNLGNPVEFTIRELAEEIARICAAPLQIEACPLPPDDPTRRRPDITRAQELLGWSPTVQLPEGLERTIPYFARRQRQPVHASHRTSGAGHAVTGDAPFVERRRPYAEAATWAERHLH
jgi:hypothetical protein